MKKLLLTVGCLVAGVTMARTIRPAQLAPSPYADTATIPASARGAFHLPPARMPASPRLAQDQRGTGLGPFDCVCNPNERRVTRAYARARAKNVHCSEEMIYYRPGEAKEFQTKTSKRDDLIIST